MGQDDSVRQNREAFEHAAYLEEIDGYEPSIERIPEVLFLVHYAKELGYQFTYSKAGPHLVQTLYNKLGDSIQIALIQAGGDVNVETGFKDPSFFGFKQLKGRSKEEAVAGLAKSFGDAQPMSIPESIRQGQEFNSTYLDQLLAKMHMDNPRLPSGAWDKGSRRAPKIINDQEPIAEQEPQDTEDAPDEDLGDSIEDK